MTVLGGARPMAGARPLGGARPLAGGLPRAASPRAGARPSVTTPRRRVSRASRTASRTGSVRALIGVVLIAFMLGLIYLAQTVHLAATNYETDLLLAQRDDLARQIQTVETSVLRWGAEPTVVEQGQRLGLDQLPTRVRLSAR